MGCVWFGYEKSHDVCAVMARCGKSIKCPYDGDGNQCGFVQEGKRQDRNEKRRAAYRQKKEAGKC